MLRLAGGEKNLLDPYLDSGTVPVQGHAVEARIYAEDPANGFRPSAGRLTGVTLPSDVRVDGWVQTGTEVTPAYDPLLAKIIVTATDRDTALDHLAPPWPPPGWTVLRSISAFCGRFRIFPRSVQPRTPRTPSTT